MKTLFAFALVFAALLTQADAQTHHHPAAPANQSPMVPMQAGQSAFAAIAEIVSILESDPATDWSKVKIEALRQHLIDMDNVTLRAEVKATPLPDGMIYRVTGSGPVKFSIQRMITAHAATMDGVDGWRFKAQEQENGADLTVRVPAADQTKLAGLGLIGVMTRGMHHQAHHLALARGLNPHH